MSHLLKRTKKSCIKFIRKLSNKQIFLKRLEEEDICEDIDISIDAKDKDINQNENTISAENSVTCNSTHRKMEKKTEAVATTITTSYVNEDSTKDTKNKRKLSIHFEEVNADKAVLQSLTSKLFLTADGYEFRRLQQLRSDTASEIVPYEGQCEKHNKAEMSVDAATATKSSSPTLFTDDTKIEVVFEKVKYKEDVRYLRHTPSTCSLDNYITNNGDMYNYDDDHYNVADDDDNLMIMNTMRNANNNMYCLDNNKNYEYNATTTTTTTTTRGLELHNNQHFVLNQEEDYEQTTQLHQQQQPNSQLLANNLPLNVSLGCIADGSYHQLFIGEERDYFYKLTPVVKWDINGNSLEDDDFPEFGLNANSSPAKSSLRSSSTTLETWLEVE